MIIDDENLTDSQPYSKKALFACAFIFGGRREPGDKVRTSVHVDVFGGFIGLG